MAPKIEPPRYRPSERLIKQGPANLQRAIETVGGWLFLTNQRLVFNSHKLNVQKGASEIDLKEIESTTPCWTKFLNLIPLVPNSLAVRQRDGAEYRFVLNGRQDWKREIDKARTALVDPESISPSEGTIGAAWERLERAVARALGPQGWAFGAPATETEIAQAERELGTTFPDEFRASLLVHNGDDLDPTDSGTVTSSGPFRQIDFLPLSTMVDEWTTWKEQIGQGGLEPNADEQVRSEWWNDRWIPVTVIGGSTNHHCLDLAPSEIGTIGQIIEISDDDERRAFVAPSYKDFLLRLAAEIESGTYSSVEGSLVHEDWL